nr:hypothetical protein [Tanacetum cinerariifolium]
MGRDTIQLETVVSTISQEYLLEFTSEYGISEDVHPELPVREEEIKKLDQEIQGLQNQTSDLNTLLEGNSSFLVFRPPAAFEEFKKYKDDRVEKRCAKMDVRLDALSIDFDEELYPHMLTAIAGRRWVIRHGLRLAVIKCGESTELRQVFADVVSAGIAKGMSEGLKYGVEHKNDNLDLKAIEAYDPEAETKYVAALHALRDLKYPIVDQLELLKDAPIDVVMASLHLEKTLHSGSASFALILPNLRPLCLAIMLADTATQTKTSEDGASPRTQSPRPLGLQPAYAASLLQEYLAYNYSGTVMDDK